MALRQPCRWLAAGSEVCRSHRLYSATSSTAPDVYEKAAASSSELIIEKESRYGAHNYHPLPAVLCRGSGIFVWDVEGKRYYDFLSGYSALNQGHTHPKIVAALAEQAAKLTLTSRDFCNDALEEFAEYATQLFGYDRLLPMNTSAEAVDTAVKLARRWGYAVKGIPDNKAKVYFAEGNFHGRTVLAISASYDTENYGKFGPLVPNIHTIPYDDLDALEEVCADPDVCGFIVEPIQGDNGVVLPTDGYFRGARDICSRHNVLFVVDEIQAGLGRAGTLLAVDHEGVRPDVVILGKALSGGTFPISCLMTDNDIMLAIDPEQHGSTYGGSPLASRVGVAALKVLVEDGLIENAAAMESVMWRELAGLDSAVVQTVRGRGLFFAIVINSNEGSIAWDVCMKLKDQGLLTKPTHDNIIPLAPPLIITEPELVEACNIVKHVINNCKA